MSQSSVSYTANMNLQGMWNWAQTLHCPAQTSDISAMVCAVYTNTVSWWDLNGVWSTCGIKLDTCTSCCVHTWMCVWGESVYMILHTILTHRLVCAYSFFIVYSHIIDCEWSVSIRWSKNIQCHCRWSIICEYNMEYDDAVSLQVLHHIWV